MEFDTDFDDRDTVDLLECVKNATEHTTELLERLKKAVNEISEYRIEAWDRTDHAETMRQTAYHKGRKDAAGDILEIIRKALKGDNNGIK